LDADDGERFFAHDGRGSPFIVRFFRDIGEERIAQLKRAFILFEHPNVAAFTDFGSGPDFAWLARPHHEGPTLQRLLSFGALPPEHVAKLVLDLLDGLEALHAADIVFDYWKADNVIWHQERWMFIDVGLRTRLDHHLGAYYPRLRHWAYLAPERLAGGPVSGKSDLYSLGSLGSHALLGAPLFQDTEEIMRFFLRVMTEEPDLRERCPDCQAGLLEALEILLNKRPEQRDGVEARAHLEQRTSVTETTPEMQGFLSFLREAGRGSEVGEFTLDPRRALEKLRDFQFPRAHHFLLPLVAGLVSRGATTIQIRAKSNQLVLKSDSKPLSEEEMGGLFLAATRRGDSLSHLGLGLIGAFGAGGQRLWLASEECQSTIRQISEQIKVTRCRGGSGICLDIEGKGLISEAPPDLRNRFLYSPASITWNGRSLNDENRLSVWARHCLEGDEFQIEGALEGSRPGLFIRVDGLTYQLAERFVLPGATVVLDGPWQTSLSYQAIRGDKRRQKLRGQASDLLLEKAAETALCSPLRSDQIAFCRDFIEAIESDKLRDLLSSTSPDAL
jgi:serine/threonine-protein kinase